MHFYPYLLHTFALLSRFSQSCLRFPTSPIQSHSFISRPLSDIPHLEKYLLSPEVTPVVCKQHLFFYWELVWTFFSWLGWMFLRIYASFYADTRFYPQFGGSGSKHLLKRLRGYGWKSAGVNCVFWSCQIICMNCKFSLRKGAKSRRSFMVSITLNHPQRSRQQWPLQTLSFLTLITVINGYILILTWFNLDEIIFFIPFLSLLSSLSKTKWFCTVYIMRETNAEVPRHLIWLTSGRQIVTTTNTAVKSVLPERLNWSYWPSHWGGESRQLWNSPPQRRDELGSLK